MYTKGEWKAQEGLWCDELYFIYVKSGDTHIARVDNESKEMCEANAQLIAAAPDLYEALKKMLPLVSGYYLQEVINAEQAIAKADGGK